MIKMKKSNKTHVNYTGHHHAHRGATTNNNNDSMMNINPFIPSDIHSDTNIDHSSMSKDGHEVVFTMKESLRDLDANPLSPDRLLHSGGDYQFQ